MKCGRQLFMMRPTAILSTVLTAVGIALAASGCSSVNLETRTLRHDNGTVAERFSYYIDENERPVYHGKMEKFYENGVLASSRTYVDGKVEGRAMFYLRNQETMYVTFKNNLADGPLMTYGPEGKLKWRGECQEGKFHGLFTFWDDKGNKIAEGTYRGGAPYAGTLLIRGRLATYERGRLIQSRPMAGQTDQAGATMPGE